MPDSPDPRLAARCASTAERTHFCAVSQLETLLETVQWCHGAPITLAGCSLGAAVAMRFAHHKPPRVGRLLLVAPAGLPEPFFMPASVTAVCARNAMSLVPESAVAESWPLRNLRLVADTPSYGLGEAAVRALARRLPLSVVLAGLDLVHSPHSEFWRKELPKERIVTLSGASHWWTCTNLFEIGLHRKAEHWHSASHQRSRL